MFGTGVFGADVIGFGVVCRIVDGVVGLRVVNLSVVVKVGRGVGLGVVGNVGCGVGLKVVVGDVGCGAGLVVGIVGCVVAFGVGFAVEGLCVTGLVDGPMFMQHKIANVISKLHSSAG